MHTSVLDVLNFLTRNPYYIGIYLTSFCPAVKNIIIFILPAGRVYFFPPLARWTNNKIGLALVESGE